MSASLLAIPEADLTIEATSTGSVGEGAFGIVQKGVWNGGGGGIPVAVKSLQRAAAEVGDAPARAFMKEIAILCEMRHPNIVQVYGVCSHADGRISLVEQLMATSLNSRLHPSPPVAAGGGGGGQPPPAHAPPLTRKEILGICQDVAKALNFSHGKGITHNDIKPHNVLLGRAGEAVLCDFGLARASSTALPETARRLRIGNSVGVGVLGTLEYTSPENLVEGHGFGEPAGDIYSFGVLLYELSSGRSPWEGRKLVQVIDDVRAGRRPPIPGGVDSDIKALITRCWAPTPAERPTAAALLQELAAMQARPPPADDFAIPHSADGKLDFGPPVTGPVAAWRAGHREALVANLSQRTGAQRLTDADLGALQGLRGLTLSGSDLTAVTPAGFGHLQGMHTLVLEFCTGTSHLTAAALEPLQGIVSLNMSCVQLPLVLDFKALRGCKQLVMRFVAPEQIAAAKAAGLTVTS